MSDKPKLSSEEPYIKWLNDRMLYPPLADISRDKGNPPADTWGDGLANEAKPKPDLPLGKQVL